MSRQLGIVTLGEAMLRLSPPSFECLEQASSFRAVVGGAELNVAVTAARLGLRTRYVSRLPQNPLGNMVRNKAREQGVDTSFIVWASNDRLGLYFLEFGASPRSNRVFYDRGASAMARIGVGEVDWKGAFRGMDVFHVSGITPALSGSATKATLEAVQTASDAGLQVSVDLNYRARLWSKRKAKTVMSRVISLANILITTEEDTKRVFGICGASYEEVARSLAKAFDLDIVAITLRENPLVWRNKWTAIALEAKTDEVHTAPSFDIEVVDRVGAGDSFAGGFLVGYLEEGVSEGLRLGVATSAIKQTMPGDLCWATRELVERVLEDEGLRIVR